MNPASAVAFVLLACATPHVPLAVGDGPARSGPFSVELVDEHGRGLATFHHRGRTYVLGALGERYSIRVWNDSGRRAEAVVSVDGRDVVDGRTASWEKRGYVVEPGDQLTIDGFRLSERSVAAFRFASVRDSYAAKMGSARDVGVVGVAVFAELEPRGPVAPYGTPRDERSAPSAESRSPAPGSAREDRRHTERRGLGTEFAEERRSRVRDVTFARANTRPETVLVLRYDDRPGLLALGIDLDRRGAECEEAWARESASPFRGDAFAEPPPGWRSR
ncbi:MAG TPA: hypothetical protein VFK85_12965 [Anaeromyxobacteraceae bacterium]|nr:hypothetical protein [Anaeromyxobacteraceae bacterium]